MAILRMSKMKFHGHHGVTEEEKKKGAEYEVDCEIETDIARCASSDNIEDAINYDKVYFIIREYLENRRFNLMETLAIRLINEIKTKSGAHSITLRVRKMEPPVGGLMAYFEVEISE